MSDSAPPRSDLVRAVEDAICKRLRAPVVFGPDEGFEARWDAALQGAAADVVAVFMRGADLAYRAGYAAGREDAGAGSAPPPPAPTFH